MKLVLCTYCSFLKWEELVMCELNRVHVEFDFLKEKIEVLIIIK